jgi:hypothetical protein
VKKEFHLWKLEKRVAHIARKSSWLKQFYANTANPTLGRKHESHLGGHYRQKKNGLCQQGPRRDNYRHHLVLGFRLSAFGFHVSNTSQDNERMQAQDAVELCRQEVNIYSGPAAGKNVIADACRKLEDELRKYFGHAP